MKSLVFLICFCLPLICFGQNDDKGFSIEIELDGLELDSFKLYDRYNDEALTYEQSILDGKIYLKGKVEKPMLAGLKEQTKDQRRELFFFLDNSDYKIILAKYADEVITKDPTQVFYQKQKDFEEKFYKKFAEVGKKYTKLIEATESEEEKQRLRNSQEEEMATLREELAKRKAQFLLKEPHLLSSIYTLYTLMTKVDINDVKNCMNDFKGDALNSDFYRKLNAYIYWKTELKEGTPMRDFTIYKLDGTPESVLNSNGKPLVLLISATYPDDYEMNFRNFTLYNKYKDKDIVFKGISWRSDLDVLKSEMSQNKFPFPVYAIDANRHDGIMQMYGIYTSPTIVVIDKEGKLVKRFDTLRDQKSIHALIESLN